MMTYRPDIDGLRAIAVLPVMLFHAGSDLFSGGFVGVDVFFVISGFLITGIILTELQQGRFSVAGFYERRARRLLPALFVVMAVCLPFAWLWMYPPALQDFAQSLLAVATFSSNLLFWQETGYWGSANELKPLLHTWSLAVEEQYYVLFPLFLLALWRWRINTLLPILMVLAVASLLLAEWGSHRYPQATFFLLPTRGWELAMGAITACVFIRHQDFIKRLRGHRGLNEGLSVLGLSLIMFAVFGFDRHTPFPGLWALIPTVGTALVIIFCTPLTHTARLLGSRLLVGIGLISYSAYLWHQPLLAFTRHRSLTEPEEWVLVMMALLSLPLAYLSWRLIEQPFRNKQRVSRRTVVWFAVLGSVVFMAIGLAGHLQQGWPDRVELPQHVNEKLICRAEAFAAHTLCQRTASAHHPTVLLGDSHSAAVAAGLATAFQQHGLGLQSVFRNACPPVRGVQVQRSDRGPVPISNRRSCFRFNEDLYRWLADHPEVKTVILAARWSLYLEGSRFDNQEGGVESANPALHISVIRDGRTLTAGGDADQAALVAEQYQQSVIELLQMGKQVILVYPIPEAGWHVPDYLSKLTLFGHNIEAATGSTDHRVFTARNARTQAALDAIGTHPNLHRIYPEQHLCDTVVAGRCVVHAYGVPFYRDDDHLSDPGARLLTDDIIPLIPHTSVVEDQP